MVVRSERERREKRVVVGDDEDGNENRHILGFEYTVIKPRLFFGRIWKGGIRVLSRMFDHLRWVVPFVKGFGPFGLLVPFPSFNVKMI